MNIYLFIGPFFLLTFLLGRLLEKIKVPWIFASLILGVALTTFNPFTEITSNRLFPFLAQLGMYFLLFYIGLELNLKDINKRKGTIIKSTLVIILLGSVLGAILVHFLFGTSWFVSFLVSLSFATVGEAVLVPILDEFNLIKTSLGSMLIGIGTLDDVFEMICLVMATVLVGVAKKNDFYVIIGALVLLFVFLIGLVKLKKQTERFSFISIESVFLLLLAVLFLFIGIGHYAHAGALGALLAGIGLRLFLPKERLRIMEKEIKALTYGFFGPLFFLWVGLDLDLRYLVASPLFVFLVIVVSTGAKIAGSYLSCRKSIGSKPSLLLGIGLSVRFSMSIVIIRFLYDNNIIKNDVYSVVVASNILVTFVVPFLFSFLINTLYPPALRRRKERGVSK